MLSNLAPVNCSTAGTVSRYLTHSGQEYQSLNILIHFPVIKNTE